MTREQKIRDVLALRVLYHMPNPLPEGTAQMLNEQTEDIAAMVERSWERVFSEHMCNNMSDEEEEDLRDALVAAFVGG